MEKKIECLVTNKELMEDILVLAIDNGLIPKQLYNLEYDEYMLNLFETYLIETDTKEYIRGLSFPSYITLNDDSVTLMEILEEIHGFNLIQYCYDNDIDILIGLSIFSLLHEIGHIKVFHDESLKMFNENKDELINEIIEDDNMEFKEKQFAYRCVPSEFVADRLAYTFMRVYEDKIINIINNINSFEYGKLTIETME